MKLLVFVRFRKTYLTYRVNTEIKLCTDIGNYHGLCRAYYLFAKKK